MMIEFKVTIKTASNVYKYTALAFDSVSAINSARERCPEALTITVTKGSHQ